LVNLIIVDSTLSKSDHERLSERVKLIRDETHLGKFQNPMNGDRWLLNQVTEDSDFYLQMKSECLVTAEQLNELAAKLERSEDSSISFPFGTLYRTEAVMAQKYKWCDAKFDGKCGECDEQIYEGDRICYDINQQTTLCTCCGEARFGGEITLDEAEELAG
jgi:hypothetical protein